MDKAFAIALRIFPLLLLLCRTASAITDYHLLPNSPAYETAAIPLRALPPGEYRFTEAKLADVLQLLADEARISFFSLPAESEEGQRIVTFTIQASPFLALETLAKSNGISLIFENGVWYLRPEKDTNLIGRVYQIKYNSREKITAQATGGNLGQVSSGSSGRSSTTTSGVDLQGTTQSFDIEESKLLEDIRELLDIDTKGVPVLINSTSVDALKSGLGSAGALALPTNATVAAPLPEKIDDETPKGKVIWNSDANTLFVVATRQQHQWIEGYLAAADTPQDQIGIEVKFFETTRDPRKEFGLDWSGTLTGGWEVSLNTFKGGLANFGKGEYTLPQTAILNFDDVNVRLRALADDLETRTVSYPRMVTTNNREVVLRSVVNQPVLAGTSSTSLGAGSTTSQAITYLPIGTVLNILPKRLGTGKIQLNVALTVSSVIGTEVINGNPFPIATSRVYNAPIEIDPGYTVAIGGLDRAAWDHQEIGIAGLRKLPVLGNAFKYLKASRARSNLLIMITPSVIDSTHGGLPDRPETVIRQSPHKPQPPVIHNDGTLFVDCEQLDAAIESLRYELSILLSKVDERSIEREDRQNLQALYQAVKATRVKLAAMAAADPNRKSSLAPYDAQLADCESIMEQARKRTRWFQF